MKILIEDLVVIFPYPLVFNQQVQYMTALKRTLDSQGHGLLQMPTGTGKTVCLLSLLIAYISNRDRYKKIIYCTRTVVQMEKTLNELKKLLKKIQDENPQCKKLLATGLTAKKNLCVHKHVNQWRSKQKVDEQCKKRTSDWVRAKRKDSIEQQQFLCQFYQNYKQTNDKLKAGSDTSVVFGMDDLKTYAQQHIRCPYYTAKDTIQTADIVVFNYLYLIDNKISGNMIKKMSRDSVVVFDEAHNIDDICIESYTIRLNKRVLAQAQENVKYIKQKINHVEQVNLSAFQKQCTTFLNKINQDKQGQTQTRLESVQIDKSKILPSSILNSNSFLQCLESVIKFYSKKLLQKQVSFSDPNILTADLRLKDINIDESFMILASQKLMHLTNILQITQMNFFRALEVITTSLLYLASYSKGFKCVFQPNAMTHQYMEPTLTLACTDASIAMAAVFRNFPSVILTSGTISPLELYPKILNFKPVILKSIDIQLTRNSIQPMIIASTADSTPISSEYLSRSNKAVTRNFANLILGLCDVVPDGILCFFPSYKYMQHVLKEWTDDKFIDQILEKRYLFIQNKDPVQAGEQLNKYRHACDIGRGAIFFAISRGKIAEGIDFQQQYGRCVIMMGFPVQNSHQLILLQRIKYMVQQKQIKDKNEFLQFDTMRQVAQCLGRVMRKKTDYGLMILADSRFNAPGKYNKLPQWIKKAMDKQLIDVTMQTANMYAAKFFRSMGQPFVLAERLFKREAYFKQGVIVQETQNRRLAEQKKLLDILRQQSGSGKKDNEQNNRSRQVINDDQNDQDE